jgi:catechol 2,3-dioxygenase-like lactoylglutathione lyase family enzyme
MPNYTGINHLAMATADMAGTIRFWRDLLGMRLVAGLGRQGYRQYFLEISPTDMIAFFEWDRVQPIEAKDHGVPVSGPLAFDHVSIGVAGRQDLWEIKDKLEAAGFWASEIVDHGFIWSLYCFDPNNIAIEFSWPVPGVDLRRSPRMADKSRPKVGLEGSEPRPGHWPTVTNPTQPEDFLTYPGEGQELL